MVLANIINIAMEAGALALEQRKTLVCESKSDGTWVTDVDQAVEAYIRQRILEIYGVQEVYGEEMGGDGNLDADICWVIDPIDGTTNFVTGLPLWGVSIGVLKAGKPFAGVFYQPATNELFAAQEGQGATLNGETIQADQTGILHGNSLVTLNSEALVHYEFACRAKVRCLGTLAAQDCYVASGAITASLGEKWKPWDVAAAMIIAFEAGAIAMDIEGNQVESLGNWKPGMVTVPMLVGPQWAVDSLLKCLHVKQGGT